MKKNNAKKLTADGLKSEVWNTLLALKAGKVDVKKTNAVAHAARTICSIVKVEISAMRLAGKTPSTGAQEFFGNDAKAISAKK